MLLDHEEKNLTGPIEALGVCVELTPYSEGINDTWEPEVTLADYSQGPA